MRPLFYSSDFEYDDDDDAVADDEGTDGTAGNGSPGFSRNTVTLPPIDAHKQSNTANNPKRRSDSEESFARKLDNMLLLPGGANADHLQTPRVEKRSRLGFLWLHWQV